MVSLTYTPISLNLDLLPPMLTIANLMVYT